MGIAEAREIGGSNGGVGLTGASIPSENIAHEFQVEQRFVGSLIGRGGESVKSIMQQTGASVSIDQSTKDMGYSTVRILCGSGADKARAVIEAKVQEIKGPDGEVTTEEIRVKQDLVGSFIGR